MKTAEEWASEIISNVKMVPDTDCPADNEIFTIKNGSLKSLIKEVLKSGYRAGQENMRDRVLNLSDTGYMNVEKPLISFDRPNKNDRCSHGQWHYEECAECLVGAIRALPIQEPGE